MSLMTGSLNLLATELINAINTYLGDGELLVLAMVSKRLHAIALTFYITRHKNSTNNVDDDHVFLWGTSFPLLKPLRMALFIRHVDKLSFGFTPRLLETDALISSLRGLRRFISHLSTLSNAEFNFGEAKPRGHAGDQRVQETIRDLLESLIGKNCSQLCIKGWRLHDESLAGREVAKSAVLSRGNIKPLTSLKQMTIWRSEIHSKELSKWLLESMNLSQIRSLTIDKVSFTAKGQTLGKFLQSLNLEQLTDFRIDSDNIDFDELVDFLLRHKRIMSLDVGKYWTSTSISSRLLSPLPVGLLPNLRRLTLEPSWVCHFLASPTSLPNLSTIIFEPNYPMWAREFTEPIISRCLEPLEQCFALISNHQSINHIRFSLPGGSWSADWLKSRIDIPIERSAEHTLMHIREIKIDRVGLAPESEVDPLLAQWLARFPALRTVAFNYSCFQFDDTTTTRRSALLLGIAVACPTVLSIHLEGVPYSVLRFKLLPVERTG